MRTIPWIGHILCRVSEVTRIADYFAAGHMRPLIVFRFDGGASVSGDLAHDRDRANAIVGAKNPEKHSHVHFDCAFGNSKRASNFFDLFTQRHIMHDFFLTRRKHAAGGLGL